MDVYFPIRVPLNIIHCFFSITAGEVGYNADDNLPFTTLMYANGPSAAAARLTYRNTGKRPDITNEDTCKAGGGVKRDPVGQSGSGNFTVFNIIFQLLKGFHYP